MTRFISSYKIELSKIFKRKKYLVFLAIQLISFLLVRIGFVTFASSAQGSVDFINFGILNVLNHIVGPLTAFMLAADIFPQEFENDAIKTVFIRPLTRSKIFFSKLLAIPTYLLVSYFLLGASLTILNIIGGYSDNVYLFSSFMLSVIPSFTIASLGVFISIIVGNSSLTMFISLIIYVLMLGLKYFNPIIGAGFFTNHLNFYKEVTVFSGSSTNTIFMFISWFIFLSIVGNLIFDRKEV